MGKSISLIDFGAGNLHSVYKALKYIGANVEITKDSNTVEKSNAVVFPGVGAFGAAINSIKKSNLSKTIIKSAKSNKPFLGICLGMQLLFEESEENPNVSGLGVFKGKVVKFKKVKKIPHTGWNSVTCSGNLQKTTACHPERSEGSYSVNKFYFVHSYYVVPKNENIICGTTDYDGEIFTSIIKKDNLLLVQFHPEKSGEAGLMLLEAFIKSV